jgi:hypothetical protein
MRLHAVANLYNFAHRPAFAAQTPTTELQMDESYWEHRPMFQEGMKKVLAYQH